eukprot:CAMPEP_0185775526 /NCGR_PEP_ID=MMETSP1174-20130828/82356_1 /TAXON_ID=35687 /ORGANISM="Dictyocha speculum, Strain CCMP1381" /LENGTH=977 /DNA_ID=CAMNT_0028463139 /DNA_START=85 /DNA_END=3015 /DNA_ORIENTATION=+
MISSYASSLIHGSSRMRAFAPTSHLGRHRSSLTQLTASVTTDATQEESYKDTVILPQTNFQQRANAINREPELQEFWKSERIYESLYEDSAPGAEKFVLHDGPPYANGDLHIGHALNKILKDFINRYNILQGKSVRFIPGWDCHGLPIELKVLQSIKSKERRNLTPLDLRRKAASFAQEAVAKQSASFQRYGVWAEWDKPYLTLQPEYEAAQIEVFGRMVLNGHIYRGEKPVHWSPSSRTALAEAELEYPEGHVSRSIYVALPVETRAPCLEGLEGNPSLAIWTTTPWTIPANLAVAVNARLDYSVVRSGSDEAAAPLVVATDLIPSLQKIMNDSTLVAVMSFSGAELAEGTTYKHPLYERSSPVVVGGEYITTESGTGLVHTAPGHGQEDYATGLKYGLDLLSPVDDGGRFTAEAGEAFVGKDVLGDGNTAVVEALQEIGALLKEEAYPHKYPYDWRTKKPTIFRSTKQWFASVDTFRDGAMKAIDEVTWTPAFGKNRISAMTASRNDWCISRQRTWGVPIPVFYHKETGDALMTQETIAHVKEVVSTHGSDAWYEMDEVDLLPESLKEEAHMWTKGRDTMDVWFDSGSSWAGVISKREGVTYPADLYLEGSDQHRGWFQSSLLTSVASNGKAPYKQVLTHGFVLDEKGFKMSKSLGNVVDPLLVIEGGNNKKKQPAYGADVLRLWVSSVDYTSDVCVGDTILKQVFESYRRLRNTARYLVGNLHDFDPEKHTVPYDDLSSLDKYILGQYSALVETVTEAYTSYQFFKASQSILTFVSKDLSSFYLDIAKDRLYISDADSPRRRSCQTVLSILLEGLARLMAPILPHMAEDVWLNMPYPTPSKSIFQSGWVSQDFPPHRLEDWSNILLLREDVKKCMEVARQQKRIGASLDAKVAIHCAEDSASPLRELLSSFSLSDDEDADALPFVLIASQVEVVGSAEDAFSGCDDSIISASASLSGCDVGVSMSEGTKCERCW